RALPDDDEPLPGPVPLPPPSPPPPPLPRWPPLRHPAPPPPHVHRSDQPQHRHENQYRPPRIPLGFLVEGGEDHLFFPADEPSNPRQDGARHKGTESGERDEPPEFHPGEPGRQRGQVAPHR